jgi:DNA-binding LytR/AlgR family response regulator
MRILIVEDELPTAQELKKHLIALEPGAEIVGLEDSVETTIEWLQKHKMPDLIFMDIQLADGLCFEIFREIDIRCPVVFCTAFDQYAIEAFRVNGVEYILKPFNREMVERAMEKVKGLQRFFQAGQEAPGMDRLAGLLDTLQSTYKTSFLVSYRDKLLPITTKDISYFHIEDEVTFVHTRDGRRFFVNHSLDELERTLDPKQFFRANRQFIVNFEDIVSVEPYFSRKMLLKTRTATKEPVVISKVKSPELVRWMNNH